MNLKPTTDHVLLKEKEVEEKTGSGLVITSTERTKTQFFEVIDIGDGILPDGKKIEMTVKPGDTVILAQYYNKFIPIEGINYLIVRLGDIIATVEE